MAFAIKILAAGFTFLGVIVGVLGTYLMTMAYHPFDKPGVVYNFFRVMGLVLTFRWSAAMAMIDDASFFGEMNPEDRAKSLRGIYVLGASFVFQTAGALLTIIDVLIGSEQVKSALH
jgi:hypothetical protein